MQAAAEALIEQLLDWDEQTERPHLTAIEDEVLALRQQFGEEMADVLVTGQTAKQPAAPPPCPQCGASMRYKGQKRKAVTSRVGELEVERGYYYCAACACGVFPLDAQLELSRHGLSQEVMRAVVWLSAVVPSYALATEATFFRHHQRRMNYLQLREDNWLIGSGTVESAAKQFKARFSGPGMRWGRQGTENLLPIRAAVLSHRFDHCRAAAKNLPPL